MNRIILLGAIEDAGEVRAQADGTPVRRIVLRVGPPPRHDAREKGVVNTHSVYLRGPMATLFQPVVGAVVAIEGGIEATEYEEGGSIRHESRIIVERVVRVTGPDSVPS